MPTFADTYARLADVSADFVPPAVTGLEDQDLLEVSRVLAEIRRRADACAALVAGELAHRSRRELGYDGLATRLGARTPEKLVQTLTGVTSREAATLVKVGTMLTVLDTTEPEAGPIWMTAVGAAVAAGRVSIDAAQAIRVGLGDPNDTITVDALTRCAEDLLRLTGSLTVEKLGPRAREYRDELDAARVAERESALREKRYLHLRLQSDGMTKIWGLLDPESAATITAVYDGATSPRRGGPRFVNPDDITRAQNLLADTRTTEQIALDTFVDLITAATTIDTGQILPVRRPEVQILVTEHDYLTRTGFAHIHGQSANLSIATVERAICNTGILPILFDHTGQPLKLGRSQRLFSPAQRKAIAARDGGCIHPTCDRPPSFTETHHINEWQAHHGKTDVADGVLLCRHHHLLVHNNGWRITRQHADYHLIPPPDIDPNQRPIPTPSKNPLLRRLVG